MSLSKRGAANSVLVRSGAVRKILGWHFVRDNRRLGHDASDLEVVPGYIYSVEPETPIILCSSGMHSSRLVYDALRYAQGSYLSRVALWGDVVEDTDKLAARHREVLWAADVSSELRLWGCWCVRQVWHLLTDERSRRAVEVAEAFARGEATREQLDAARAAARAAAWAAAGAAARAAAWAAARAAAWAAAGAAAGAAAWAAAWAAARDAARDAQAEELERRMLALVKVQA